MQRLIPRAVLLVAVLLAIGAWLAPRSRTQGTSVPKVPRSVGEVGVPRGAVAELEAQGHPPVPTAGPNGPKLRRAATEGDWWRARTPFGPAEWPLVHGQVVVVDPDGAVHTRLNGRFVLKVQGPAADGGDSRGVAVKQGRWCARVAPDAKIAFGTISMGGRFGWFEGEPSRWVSVPVDGVCDLRVHWPPLTVLDVRGSAGESLGEVEIALKPLFSDREEWRTVDSPIALVGDLLPTLPSEDASYKVRGAGAAEQMVVVNLRRGGVVTVNLEPGGDLELEVVHGRLILSTRIEISGKGFQRSREFSGADDDSQVFRALPEGRVLVRAMGGNLSGPRLELGRVEVDIPRAGLARASLVVEELPAPRFAHMEGTIFLPEGWGEAFELSVQFGGPALAGTRQWQVINQDDPRVVRLSAKGALWSWELGEQVCGSYFVSLSGLPFGEPVEFDEGYGDLRIELPPPTDLVVRAVDGVTGVGLGGQDLDVWYEREGRSQWGAGRLTWDPERDAFLGRVPTGPLELCAVGSRYAEQLVELSAGRRELTLTMGPATGVTFRLLVDGALTWDDGVWVEAEEGEGRGFESESAYDLVLPGPGQYRISVWRLGSDWPIHQFELQAGEGMSEHILDLAGVGGR
jgi:hypothetical protein